MKAFVARPCRFGTRRVSRLARRGRLRASELQARDRSGSRRRGAKTAHPPRPLASCAGANVRSWGIFAVTAERRLLARLLTHKTVPRLATRSRPWQSSGRPAGVPCKLPSAELVEKPKAVTDVIPEDGRGMSTLRPTAAFASASGCGNDPFPVLQLNPKPQSMAKLRTLAFLCCTPMMAVSIGESAQL